MSEYVFSWEMTRRLAKKLVWQQFKHYYLLKYFLKYLLVGESLLAIMILTNFHDPEMFKKMTLLWLGITILIVYGRFFRRMLPEKRFAAEYGVHFNKNGFEIRGKTYRRRCTYDQIDRLIIKKDSLIFVTGYEGMILPAAVFKSDREKQLFVEYIAASIREAGGKQAKL